LQPLQFVPFFVLKLQGEDTKSHNITQKSEKNHIESNKIT